MKNFEGVSDEALALLYVKGDNRAFDELLSRTQTKLFTYIMCIPTLASSSSGLHALPTTALWTGIASSSLPISLMPTKRTTCRT